ncbi:MAG: stage II sporulation protein M, partial [Geitlerinemataceae cyanobacterium]
MNVRRWIARREPNWKQLETLLRKVEKKGISTLTPDEVQQMASLYRSVSADLARSRTFDVGTTVIRDLQQLTSRSYNQIYQG